MTDAEPPENDSILTTETTQITIAEERFDTCLNFCMYLRGVLDSDLHVQEVKLDGMLTGSDKEAALVKAMRAAFPNTKHLFCMLHCEDNVRDHVTKDGVQMAIKVDLD